MSANVTWVVRARGDDMGHWGGERRRELGAFLKMWNNMRCTERDLHLPSHFYTWKGILLPRCSSEEDLRDPGEPTALGWRGRWGGGSQVHMFPTKGNKINVCDYWSIKLSSLDTVDPCVSSTSGLTGHFCVRTLVQFNWEPESMATSSGIPNPCRIA